MSALTGSVSTRDESAVYADNEGLAIYLIRTHTCSTHTVVMTRPDFLEKNEIAAGGLPLASACLLISVTLNTVLLLLFTHFFPPSEPVNAPVCAVAHFSCPDTG